MLTVVVLYTVVKTVADPREVALETTSLVELRLEALTAMAAPQDGSGMSTV